jgi:hypothetical protein
LHAGDLGFAKYRVDLWCCLYSVVRLLTFTDRHTVCLLDIRAASQFLGAERITARDLFASSVDDVIENHDVGFHGMSDLAAVGGVEDPVMVLQFRLNAKASAGEVAESRRRTAEKYENGVGRSMP